MMRRYLILIPLVALLAATFGFGYVMYDIYRQFGIRKAECESKGGTYLAGGKFQRAVCIVKGSVIPMDRE
jgi:hypothetical protein